MVDCRLALELGSDYVGVVVEVERSPRSVSVEQAGKIFSAFPNRAVLLTWGAPLDWLTDTVGRLKPAAIQLTGEETPDYLGELKTKTDCPVWKSVHLPAAGEEGEDLQIVIGKIGQYRAAGCELIILDTSDKKAGLYGGTGLQSDWSFAATVVQESPLPIFLAGGINSENVVQAVRQVQPKGVDLASGVEEKKGKKSREKLIRFFDRLKSVEASS